MEHKCAYCLSLFWKPTYDGSDSQKCRRCTMFINMQDAWKNLKGLTIPEPAVLAYDW